MGEHDAALLREAGFDAPAIAMLRALGVIAQVSGPPHDAPHSPGHASAP